MVLDPAKRYYISVLPGDAIDPGHAMGGAQVVYKNGAWQPVTVIVEPMPLPTGDGFGVCLRRRLPAERRG